MSGEVMSTDQIVVKLAPTIARAIEAALDKHGPFTNNPLRGCAILTEEVGEVAQAALGVTKSPPYATEEELFAELIHVCAVSIMMILAFCAVPIPETPSTNNVVN